MLTYPATWYLTAGIVTERQPMSAHPSVVPFQFFATADGFIAVACPKEKFFRALARSIDLAGLIDDPRFRSFADRREHRQELLSLLGDRFRKETTELWMERLRGSVPCAPVRSLPDALDPTELQSRDMLASYPHPVFGEVREVGTPFTLDGFAPTYHMAPPLGGDNAPILEELGYSPDQIAELAAAGAFGLEIPQLDVPPSRTDDRRTGAEG
jgi:crotonobetainyl-CoA:carnitine CoA-transferase CaiB-like acyl-CoA transferase